MATIMTPEQRQLMGKRFKLARRIRNRPLDRDFYRECHLTPSLLEAIEAGKKEPTAHQFMAFGARTGARLCWLLGQSEDYADELPKNGARVMLRPHVIR
jgi:hypothetical protein